jgi:hypothetical protein
VDAGPASAHLRLIWTLSQRTPKAWSTEFLFLIVGWAFEFPKIKSNVPKVRIEHFEGFTSTFGTFL